MRRLVVHPVDRAACVTKGGYFEVAGPFCPEPKLTTGAGDHFNAGFAFGALQGFAPEDCLLLGVAVSGYYVRSGKSPDLPEVKTFLAAWDAGTLV